MKKQTLITKIIPFLCVFTILVLLSGCGDEGGGDIGAPGNQRPVAEAGDDQNNIAVNTLVTLGGGGSTDPDGDTLIYAWTQASGTVVVLTGANTATATFTPAATGTYEFRLTVTDDGMPALSHADEVVITVIAPTNCGNGVKEAGEACDTGGESAACDDDCTAVVCGDSNPNQAAGEACDGGGETAACDDDCTAVVCGDSNINQAANETCDAGANNGKPGNPPDCVDAADTVCNSDCDGEMKCNPWVEIEAGDFQMGDIERDCPAGTDLPDTIPPDGEDICSELLFTAQDIATETLGTTYYMQTYEVTNAQYEACEDAVVCTHPSRDDFYTYGDYYVDAAYDNYPVMFVSWDQASVYCNWIGGQLPTEAQWEKAARGPADDREFPWDPPDQPNCNRATYIQETPGDPTGAGIPCVNGTTEVGSHPTGDSPYGLKDMAGNVWEFTSDWYNVNDTRVCRGGSWAQYTWTLRVSFRDACDPDRCVLTPEALANCQTGFRCAKD